MKKIKHSDALEYGLTGHLESYFNCFLSFCEVEDKDVLEIGGAMPGNLVIEKLGVRSWTAVQSLDYAEQRQDNQVPPDSHYEGRYRSIFENIENLNNDPSFNSCCDLIFSAACFEHIHRFPDALEVMYSAMRPGGCLFTAFAPIWSGPWGHHYDFGVPDRFRLIEPEGGWNSQNMFGPWDHLIYSRSQFYELYRKRFDDEFARYLVYMIYNSPHINRFFFEDYQSFIGKSDFSGQFFQGVFRIEETEKTMNAVSHLQAKFSDLGYNNFNDAGIVAFLQR
jgi:SAM-dependent methyltransferase